MGSVIVVPSVRFELRNPNLTENHGDHLSPQLHHPVGHDLIAEFGEVQSAKALGISKEALAALISGSLKPAHVRLAKTVGIRMPAALASCAKLHRAKSTKLVELRAAIQRDGLRETARRLGVDPSNLRRRLRV